MRSHPTVDAAGHDRVIGARIADKSRITDYLCNGTDASGWEPTYPDDPAISDYGREAGAAVKSLTQAAAIFGSATFFTECFLRATWTVSLERAEK